MQGLLKHLDAGRRSKQHARIRHWAIGRERVGGQSRIRRCPFGQRQGRRHDICLTDVQPVFEARGLQRIPKIARRRAYVRAPKCSAASGVAGAGRDLRSQSAALLHLMAQAQAPGPIRPWLHPAGVNVCARKPE